MVHFTLLDSSCWESKAFHPTTQNVHFNPTERTLAASAKSGLDLTKVRVVQSKLPVTASPISRGVTLGSFYMSESDFKLKFVFCLSMLLLDGIVTRQENQVSPSQWSNRGSSTLLAPHYFGARKTDGKSLERCKGFLSRRMKPK
jgi:hypothetical protein